MGNVKSEWETKLAVCEIIPGRSKLPLSSRGSSQRSLRNARNLWSAGVHGFSGQFWDQRLPASSSCRLRSGSRRPSGTLTTASQSSEQVQNTLSETIIFVIMEVMEKSTSCEAWANLALFSFSAACISLRSLRCSFAFCRFSSFITGIFFLMRSTESIISRTLPANGDVGVFASTSGILDLFGVVTEMPSNGVLTTCFATIEKSSESIGNKNAFE